MIITRDIRNLSLARRLKDRTAGDGEGTRDIGTSPQLHGMEIRGMKNRREGKYLKTFVSRIEQTAHELGRAPGTKAVSKNH